MTAGSVEARPAREPAPAPILVLGLGNLLLGDDALGLQLLSRLSADALPNVEFVDGGTQGLALLGYLSDRRGILILDAVGLGAAPGAVHVLDGADLDGLRARRSTTAHEGNALELLSTARLMGEKMGRLIVVGVEPARVATGIGLSEAVEAALPAALQQARCAIRELAGPTPQS